MSRRKISHSEITTALECPAKHAFQYTGHLTGGQVLKPHAPEARLRAGRAWGRGVAAFHMANPGLTGTEIGLTHRYMEALREAVNSLDEDAAQMRAHGFYDETEHHDLVVRISDILWHYVTTTEPLTISDPEFPLDLPIPSRSGKGLSNRYAFEGYLDGIAEIDDRLWPVEYKLRDTLSDFEQVADSPQIRRYAWAVERQRNIRVAGVIVDERLSVTPKPARWVTAKRKGEGLPPFNEKGYGRLPSHAKDQLTTSASYLDACHEAGVDPDPETIVALDARHWQKRHVVLLKRSEIEEAGRELVSAAQYIAQLDGGALHPIRNRAPWRCRSCQFKQICNDPSDLEVVEANFELKAPKRLRSEALEGAIS